MCQRCRVCVHKVAPALRVVSLLAGLLMVVGGILGAISFNPFVILQGFFLAVLGMTVIGAECAWDFVLRRAAFLASYSGKGLFFIYIAMPLLESGWAEYKDCILFWTSGPCPTTPADPDDDRGRWERLLVQSPLVHVAVGVALSVAGVVHLIFALTGPPPAPHQHGAKGEEASVQQAAAEPEAPQQRRGSTTRGIEDPLLGADPPDSAVPGPWHAGRAG